jgi:hypothetical protein
VKRYIVPVFIEATGRNDTFDLIDATFDEQTFLSALAAAAADFSPLLDAAVQDLLQNGLYDFSVSANKMTGSFTTYLSTTMRRSFFHNGPAIQTISRSRCTSSAILRVTITTRRPGIPKATASIWQKSIRRRSFCS